MAARFDVKLLRWQGWHDFNLIQEHPTRMVRTERTCLIYPSLDTVVGECPTNPHRRRWIMIERRAMVRSPGHHCQGDSALVLPPLDSDSVRIHPHVLVTCNV